MFLPVLKRFVIVVFIAPFALLAGAQQTHFVYLQTENDQSFYVKINNKVISSSSAGYLILPKLADGVYKLSIGFPKREFPEEDFQIVIDKKNEGFLLKNFGEKGWGLFNMQSYTVAMGGNNNAIVSAPKNLQDDPFSKLLANVVRDSSILQKNEPVKEEIPAAVKVDSMAADSGRRASPKTDSGVAAAGKPPQMKADSTVTATDKPVSLKVDSTNSIVEKPAPPLLFPATRFLSKENKEGTEMIYIDHNQGLNDTIRIFIPLRKPVIKPANSDSASVQNTQPSVAANNDTGSVIITDSTAVQNAKQPPESLADATLTAIEKPVQMKPDTSLPASSEMKNIRDNKDTAVLKDTTVLKKTDEVNQAEIKSQHPAAQPANKGAEIKAGVLEKDDIVVMPRVVQSSAINSDCKAFASNEDFLKLRKKMAAENSDDDMIRIAKKAFHVKCFSTEQIKNISFLFLTNAGKYGFFDVAYPFASDSEQYKSLETQLTDSYYINRFKAMIHK